MLKLANQLELLGLDETKRQLVAAGATVVNAFPVFNGTADEKATLCQLTAYCTSIKDIHPTNAGYEALAKLFLAAAG